MPTWDDDDKNTMFEAFWMHGQARCGCGAVTIDNYSESISNYNLSMRCPQGCGSLQMNRGMDPRRSLFREWDAPEQAMIMRQVLAQEAARCPVDSTRLKVNRSIRNTDTQYIVSCPRCGKFCQKNYPNK